MIICIYVLRFSVFLSFVFLYICNLYFRISVLWILVYLNLYFCIPVISISQPLS